MRDGIKLHDTLTDRRCVVHYIGRAAEAERRLTVPHGNKQIRKIGHSPAGVKIRLIVSCAVRQNFEALCRRFQQPISREIRFIGECSVVVGKRNHGFKIAFEFQHHFRE